MEAFLIVLTLVNVLISAAVLALVLMARRSSVLQPQPQQLGGAGGGAEALLRAELPRLGADIRKEQQEQRAELSHMLRAASESQSMELAREREARANANKHLNEVLALSMREVQQSVERRLDVLRTQNEEKLEGVRQTLGAELEKLRQGNETKLDQMRATVDEKLQGTLEKRLGDSFSLVSERLEQVQKGLGEMQTLASDVGGLKRVLTNVKSRGSWGEVQLARQLEDVLTPEQYAANVATIPHSAERVEYAVKLPGNGESDAPLWLPIDSKFPQEDYERLLTAQEAGDPAAVEAAGRDIERAILVQAKSIVSKYVEPPHTTDFGIMYLPTEGLFAEVMRRPGFVSKLQNEHRIAVVGPTTLMSLLNSFQMGFRTLAIERRSSEVWKVLSAAKVEFEKYGDAWDKVGKQLKTVQNTVDQVGTRTRALQKKLSAVEAFEPDESSGELLGEALPDMLTIDSELPHEGASD